MDNSLEVLILSFTLVVARTGTFMAMLPLLGGRFVPRFIKAVLSLMLALFWFETFAISSVQPLPDAPATSYWVQYGMLLGKEVALGAIMGFTFSLFILPFRIAGEFIGQEMGLTLARITDPTAPTSGTVIGQMFELIGVFAIFVSGTHHLFIAAIHASFTAQPIGAEFGAIPIDANIRAVATSQEWGLLLAAPVACSLFIITIVLAMLSRATPQLNLLSVGFPMRLLVGLLALVVFLPELSESMKLTLSRFRGLVMEGF
jgi:flagellar biosynthetic protein FliR